MQYKYDAEESLKVINSVYSMMADKGIHNDLTFAGDFNLFDFDNFKKEFELLITTLCNKTNLISIYTKCYTESSDCIKIYEEKIKKLPLSKNGMIEPNSAAVVLDLPINGNTIYAFKIDKTICICSGSKYSSFVYEYDFFYSYSRSELNQYCKNINDLLKNCLFEQPLFEPTNKSSEVESKKKVKLQTSGDYKILCYILGQLFSDNGKKYYFTNSENQLANFIYNCFDFDKGQNPQLIDIYFALTGKRKSEVNQEKANEELSKLNWVGNQNQIYYIFKMLHHTQRELTQFNISDTLGDIAQFLFENIIFKNDQPTSCLKILNVLKKKHSDIVSKLRRPNLNFNFSLLENNPTV